MDFVTSKDGTAIAFERSGQGPPLVVVHGTTADHRRWRPILPDLERHFCVYAMDRRGRGSSGDAEDYAINREYEDVAAVVEVAGEQVRLLGHSFGALCALEAAFRTTRLHQLVLYEPVFPVDGAEVYPPHARRKFTALLESGDREGLLTAFFKELVGMPESEIQTLKTGADWPHRLNAAHTLVREMADGAYEFSAARIARLTVPVLLLVGGNSPPVIANPSAKLAEALPNSRTAILPGQGHAAISTAPELFLHEVLAFLDR